MTKIKSNKIIIVLFCLVMIVPVVSLDAGVSSMQVGFSESPVEGDFYYEESKEPNTETSKTEETTTTTENQRTTPTSSSEIEITIYSEALIVTMLVLAYAVKRKRKK